jgi:hypothetical protein
MKPPRPDQARQRCFRRRGLVGLAGLVGWVEICRNWAQVADLLGMGGPREPLAGLMRRWPRCCWARWRWPVVAAGGQGAPPGLDRDRLARPRPWRAVLRASAVKLVGLWATWALIGFAYCFSALLAGRLAVRDPADGGGAGAAGGALAGLCVAGSRAGRAARRGWHFGALLLGDARADRAEVALHLRRWAVKGFFTAFMLSILPGGFAYVVQTSPAALRAIRWRWPTG